LLNTGLSLTLAFACARDRVGQWLKANEIQEIHGAGAGGIAGIMDRHGRRAFLYGEITGYWLRWASLYAPDPLRMGPAVDFLARQWSTDEPAPTRTGAAGDWRNKAVFSFDLAMILRGLGDAAPIVGAARAEKVAARLIPWLERMIGADGRLMPFLSSDDTQLPARWSTRAGPFQAKTAAAILAAPANWLSPRLAGAAEATIGHYAASDRGHRELHADFYALEGLSSANVSIAPDRIVAALRPDGSFPEYADEPDGPPRADVQAQAIRLLCLHAPGHTASIHRIAEALLRHIRDDNSVSFRVGGEEANIWCALFTHQALDWLCRRESDATAPRAQAII
jgi:hypothetical protein